MDQEYRGIFTPLLSPVGDSGSIDLNSLARLVDFQLENGVHGLWAMGTSAEFAAFDELERAEAIRTIVSRTAGRGRVIANISDAGTRLAIRHGERALAAGADAVAATPPYYYPHSQDEILEHYRELRASLNAPLFIYNIPQTVRARVELATARQLVSEGTVRGIKDSQNDLEWFRQLAMFATAGSHEFALFAGTRHLIDAAVLAGADGAIPSIANAFPDVCVDVYTSAARGDFASAARTESAIIAVEALTSGKSAGSRNAATLGMLKAILHHRGVIASPRLSSPLRQMPDAEIRALLAQLESLGQPLAGKASQPLVH